MKKICIVSYYWPPAGGPGVQRWLLFSKYLPEFGYEPTVYIPSNPSYPIIDESLISEVSPKINIIKNKIWEPYSIAEKFSKKNKNYKAGHFDEHENQSFFSRLSIFIRGNFFIPDARKFWINPSVKYLEKYLRENNINILVTTGPPHSMHLIGLKLKKLNSNLKWIADFRDPWTQISYHSELKLTSFAKKKHKKLEKEILQSSDLVLATSYTDAKNFKIIGAKNVSCITNGFDTNIKVFSKSNKTEKFTISYVGMLEVLRNPENLWKILNELTNQNTDFKKNFELKFVGKINSNIINQLEDCSFKKNIVNKGYLSHKESIDSMLNSDLLLITNFKEDQSKGIIPAKLFEYLASEKNILSIGPKDADVSKILSETNTGMHFSHNDSDNIKKFITNEFLNWKNDIIKTNPVEINKFHRKELTKKLVEEINKL